MRLSFLRSLYEDAGWFVSVYLETSRTSPDAGKQTVPVRWRDTREELARDGADTATVDAVGEVLTSQTAPAAAAFGRSGTVPVVADLRAPPLRELARWAPLPHVMPLLVQSPPQPPHLLVSANRAGGEVLAVHTPDDVLKERVEGTGWPVHRTKVGGWSQLEHQRSAEEAWETNAKELAAVVASAAAQIGPELVVVAGDVRARGMLIDKLPTDLRQQTVVVERELPVDSEELAEAAGDALRAAADAGTRARLESYRGHLAAGRGTEGLADTVAALRNGQVAEVFLGGDYLSGDPRLPALRWASAPAWIGPSPADIGLTEEDLRDRGVGRLQQDRIDAALVRAMAGTDAELFLVPAGEAAPREDIGALLRFAAPLV